MNNLIIGNMSKRLHIVIAEPSAIIRCGIVTILQRVAIPNITFAEVSDISAITTGKHTLDLDMLIVSPSLIGQFSHAQIRSEIGNEALKIVALQSSFVDQLLLQSYDDIISIYDSVDTIKDKIVTIMQDSNDSGVKKELSSREKEIIVCVVKGMTNKQIADLLYLSAHTVIAHRRNIANKLQIHSPSGLTIYAIVNKLVSLSEIKSTITQSDSNQ